MANEETMMEEEMTEEELPAEGIDEEQISVEESTIGGLGSFSLPVDAVAGLEKNKTGDKVRIMINANLSDIDENGIASLDLIDASLEGSGEENIPPTSPIAEGLTAGEEEQAEVEEEITGEELA
jgi:hypothetical protein